MRIASISYCSKLNIMRNMFLLNSSGIEKSITHWRKAIGILNSVLWTENIYNNVRK
ncbi:unnamed protein product [Nezara viridula]|uniref:Uncharacterized protein n=1 Tax=Nezara viridula TaxID=85310 RepID=A0A9P0E7Z6_NEZVI|nr:unnamed protein product [Nezara viridula]